MNSTSEPNTAIPAPDSGSRLQALGEEIFGPVRATRDTVRRRIRIVRSVFAYAGLITTLVQIVVWLLIAVVTVHLDSPWWLWTAVPAAVAVAALTVADRWWTWWSGSR